MVGEEEEELVVLNLVDLQKRECVCSSGRGEEWTSPAGPDAGSSRIDAWVLNLSSSSAPRQANSCRSLEPRATDAVLSGDCTLPGRTTPPLFSIGPLMKPEEELVPEKRGGQDRCLSWLDTQAKASVVFLCFGSLGRFSAEQITEIAAGLDISGQRFLWVVRLPPGGDLDELLPRGFLERTKDRGLLVTSWAPQRQVLAHGSVGGFVTHSGWNSVLEAVVAGVPMLGWPLYAEQRMNSVSLVDEMRLAVAVEGREGAVVTAEEIGRKLSWLMDSDGGRELRERTLAAMREARKALCDGGDSRKALLQLVQELTCARVQEGRVMPMWLITGNRMR